MRTKKETYWLVGFLAINAAILGIWGNPLLYFWEAGPSAYYQARVAYERGSSRDKAVIAEVMVDEKITMHEYSDKVFPAYMRTPLPGGGESVFPEVESSKTLARLRSELIGAINGFVVTRCNPESGKCISKHIH